MEILPQRFVKCDDVDATISQCLQQQDEALTHATEYGLQLGYDLGTGAATAWGLFMPSLVV